MKYVCPVKEQPINQVSSESKRPKVTDFFRLYVWNYDDIGDDHDDDLCSLCEFVHKVKGT